jgi:hypothetical protein
MPSSTNKGYTQPTYNSESGTWGTDINNNLTGILDLNLGGATSVSLSNVNVTLTTTQARNLTVQLTGTLLTNVSVFSGCIGFYCVENYATTGAFAITWFANFGAGNVGTGIVIPAGIRAWVLSDTTYGARIVAWSLITNSTDSMVYITASNTYSTTSLPSFGRSLIGSTSASAAKSLIELSQSVTASSASLTIDMSLGWDVSLTLSASVSSIAFSNWPAAGILGRLTLDITNTGSYTLSGWPATTRWPGGTIPTVTANGRDTIIITSSSGGSPFRGFLAGQGMA